MQIPALVRQANASGVVRYIGRGLNRWSNVHIADVAALYVLGARPKRRPAAFMYVESGEEALGEIAKAIAARLDLGAAQSWPAEEAIAAWGRNMAVLFARLQQPRARQSCGRARLVANAAVDHGVDRRRTRLRQARPCRSTFSNRRCVTITLMPGR